MAASSLVSIVAGIIVNHYKFLVMLYVFIISRCLKCLFLPLLEVDSLLGSESEQMLRHLTQHLHRHASQRPFGSDHQCQGNTRFSCQPSMMQIQANLIWGNLICFCCELLRMKPDPIICKNSRAGTKRRFRTCQNRCSNGLFFKWSSKAWCSMCEPKGMHMSSFLIFSLELYYIFFRLVIALLSRFRADSSYLASCLNGLKEKQLKLSPKFHFTALLVVHFFYLSVKSSLCFHVPLPRLAPTCLRHTWSMKRWWWQSALSGSTSSGTSSTTSAVAKKPTNCSAETEFWVCTLYKYAATAISQCKQLTHTDKILNKLLNRRKVK